MYATVARFGQRLARNVLEAGEFLSGANGTSSRSIGAAQRRLTTIERTLGEFEAYLGTQPKQFDVFGIWGHPNDAVKAVRQLGTKLDRVADKLGTKTGYERVIAADRAGFDDVSHGVSQLLTGKLASFIFL